MFFIFEKICKEDKYKKIFLMILKEWGLGIGDCGLGPIPNPQSPIPNPHLYFFIKDKIIFFNLI